MKLYACKEPLIATLGILIAGFITIPFAADLSGNHIDTLGAIKMSFIFAAGRFIWLYLLRIYFLHHE